MQLSRWCGIRVRLNPVFFLFLLAYAYLGLALEALLYFTLILTHETAHLLVASLVGMKVTEIEILPFGSRARIPELPTAPAGTQLAVALAGPTNNLVLLAAGLLLEKTGMFDPQLMETFLLANMVLAMFNLLPVAPLDGGWVARIFLSSFFDYSTAARMVAQLGRLAGLLLAGGAVLYLIWNRVLVPGGVALGCFLFWAASQEMRARGRNLVYRLSQKAAALEEAEMMPLEQIAVRGTTSVRSVCERFSDAHYHLVWVLNDEMEIQRVLTENQLLEGIIEEGIRCTLDDLVDDRR